MKAAIFLLLVATASVAGDAGAKPKPGKVNVLYLISDDLRPEVGSYSPGHAMYTPNLDKLAKESVSFDRAYVQQSLCNPSRASFMTGRRPDSTKVWNIINNFREADGNEKWTTMPGLFKKAGFRTLGSGKTFHPTNWLNHDKYADEFGMYDGLHSWSLEALPYRNYCFEFGVSCLPCPNENGWKMGNVTNGWCMIEALEDRLVANHAIDLLKSHLFWHKEEPFFLMAGFHKPHMPWQARKDHFDHYPLESIPVPTGPSRLAPRDMPDIAWVDEGVLNPQESLTDNEIRTARRAYYAAVTGMDEQLGRVMDALEEAGVANNTIVIFHSDHGWHLGEHAEWSKMSNFEIATRIPMMLKVPWMPETFGTRVDELCETVDIMPTLADLTGVDVSKYITSDETPLEGVSIVPTLKGVPVKDVAFSQYPRAPANDSILWAKNGIDHHVASAFKYMGYSARTKEWRYTEWYRWNQTTLEPIWNQEGYIASELYDHRGEDATVCAYNDSENYNIVAAPEHKELIAGLSKALKDHYIGKQFTIKFNGEEEAKSSDNDVEIE